MSYRVHFPAWAPHTDWEEGFKQGRNPDRFPYGLQHLSSVLSHVEYGDEIFRSRFRAFRRDSSSTLHISWDERSGLNAWMASGRPRWATGVIWATDEVRAGASPLRRAAIKHFLLQCELLWVLSSAQIGPLRRWLGPKAPRIEFLRFGIDTDFFTPHDEPSTLWDVISVGNDADRDRKLLFDALDILRSDGQTLRALVQCPENEQLPPNVVRLEPGSAFELKKKYLQSRMAVIATRTNLHVSGMTVALEAQALGVPVVATHTPGFESYLRNGISGLFVDHTASGLAEAIQGILSKNHLVGYNATGQESFTADHSSKVMMKLLGEMIQDAEDLEH